MRRVAESRATVPDVTLGATADVTGLDDAALPGALLAAVAGALRAHPRANGAYRDGAWDEHERVNLGLALETDETLVVPTIPDADELSADELGARREQLAERTGSGTLAARDLSGATFTLWTTEAERVTPVIVPPQAGALGAGAPQARPVVRDGAVVPGRTVALTLAADHRILFGHAAAAFLQDVVARLEAA